MIWQYPSTAWELIHFAHQWLAPQGGINTAQCQRSRLLLCSQSEASFTIDHLHTHCSSICMALVYLALITTRGSLIRKGTTADMSILLTLIDLPVREDYSVLEIIINRPLNYPQAVGQWMQSWSVLPRINCKGVVSGQYISLATDELHWWHLLSTTWWKALVYSQQANCPSSLHDASPLS